jgi:hypothetical protein
VGFGQHPGESGALGVVERHEQRRHDVVGLEMDAGGQRPLQPVDDPSLDVRTHECVEPGL